MRRHSSLRHAGVASIATLILTMSSSHVVRSQTGATIRVTTTLQGIANDGRCSLQEAIHSANFDEALAPAGWQQPIIYFNTGCEAGSGHDVIELQAGAIYDMMAPVDDPYNPLGPTATPIVLSPITIEARGAQLRRANPGRDFSGLPNFRAFAVSFITTACVQIDPIFAHLRRDLQFCGVDPFNELGLGATQGSLTIRNAYITGFTAKGGSGASGGGGGLGAGGAIYVARGILTVENSTFQDNGAGGGHGSSATAGGGGGGGGGLAGNGGHNLGFDNGGGGGGSRGDGSGPFSIAGGGGGGRVSSAADKIAGQPCGGNGGGLGAFGSEDGDDAACAGGGGGGGMGRLSTDLFGGSGGQGSYGGGGGGPGDGAGAGGGGFGGGGGGARTPGFSGGDGGFGGGGGSGVEDSILGVAFGGPGRGGSFAGSGDDFHGGGGGALGGAVFGDNAQITILNSTFYANYVLRGLAGGGDANSGRGAGGAIFSVDGSLDVRNSTFYQNETTVDGGGLVVYRSTRDGFSASLTLLNSIFAQNTSLPGRGECYFLNSVGVLQAGSNLITNNADDALKEDFDGSPYRDPHGCPGWFSDIDPDLQPLRMNHPGQTPTLAILESSSAADLANGETSLATDQRGVVRPQLNGWDIGAYEARQAHFVLDLEAPTEMELGEAVSFPITVISAESFMDTVAFAIDAGTSGLEASLDVAAVTPTPGQSRVVTMTIRAGSDAVGGKQTLELTATSGVNVRRVVMFITVGVSTAGMARTIDEFRLQGDIANLGVATALTSKLTVAQTLIDEGDLQAGINTLAAFGLQTRALSGKQIATGAAERLLANLDLLMTTVSPQATPNPLIGTVADAAGLPVKNATVTVLNDQSIVASATTDATGFYYVARTTNWPSGTSCTVKVTVPKGYKRATPSLLTFTWTGSQILLPTVVLSK